MKCAKSTSLFAALLLTLRAIATVAVPPGDDIERRINAVLARMTLEEKPSNGRPSYDA